MSVGLSDDRWVGHGCITLCCMVLQRQVVVRLSEEQYAKLVAAARAKDRSVGWVVRSLVDRLAVADAR